jgi:LmbE family N-acetylglucosaminyl deacetylase
VNVYLQPHSDDVCFSLADTARHAPGALVTVLPRSPWVHPAAVPHRPTVDEVTALRIAEDRTFAAAAGLTPYFLDLPEAAGMGWRPFDRSRLADNVARIGGPLTAHLRQLADAAEPGRRPWLFCPAGIGGHVDHLAVRDVVIAARPELSRVFRIGFYEDLHYASQRKLRAAGLARLFGHLGSTGLTRWVRDIGADAAAFKVASIAGYATQHRRPPTDLAEFSPATFPSSPPHEAVWTTDGAPDGFAAAPFDAIAALASAVGRI